MKTIFKYPIKIQGEFEMELPQDAKILKVDAKQGLPCMWAMVNPEAPKTKRKFHIFGTGHALPEKIDALDHVGTFIEGHLVWHLFEDGFHQPQEN
jgi:hypothetical protein